MSLVIRRAEPADIPAMSAVLIAAITELCVADHGNDPEKLAAWTRNKTVDGVAAMLGNADLLMLVAERAGSVVAVGAVTRSGDIALNYVAPEARFTGVSKALLVQLETELLELGLREASLESTETARRFYADAGWIADGPQAVGRKVNGFPMRKRLG